MKIKQKTLFVRVLLLFAGLVIAHLGVTLFLLADLGADPFNVFVQGVFRALSGVMAHPLWTHGNVHVCISIAIIAVLLAVDRSYVKIGTLLCMLCGGPIIDLFSLLLAPLFSVFPGMGFKLAMLAAGCVILAFGMTVVIRSEAGTGPNDLISVVISDKTGKKFGLIRVLADCAFVLIGYILGGTPGIGTVICAFLVGPVAGVFLPLSGRLVRRCVAGLDTQSTGSSAF